MDVTLRLPQGEVALGPGAPLLMGVVNASPDSFSDRRDSTSVDEQFELALRLRDEGADIIDVGGESGVTNRAPRPAEEESGLVVPLVERLVAEGVVVSVDTWKLPVVETVLAAGAAIVNDVSGLADPAIAAACACAEAALVIMHTRAPPKQKLFPAYDDVTADVVGFLAERTAVALGQGMDREQVIVDPGPDFAKTPADTVTVLRRLADVHRLGRPILLAVSRKDFIGVVTGRKPHDRLAGTLAAIGEGVDAGATILRVHDVREVADFLAVRRVLRGEADVAADARLDDSLRRE